VAGTHWIVEGKIDPRWPINTRGNIGEVFPEVLTPLSYTLGVLAAETGWRDAYRQWASCSATISRMMTLSSSGSTPATAT
jgi:hypothetical protein